MNPGTQGLGMGEGGGGEEKSQGGEKKVKIEDEVDEEDGWLTLEPGGL